MGKWPSPHPAGAAHRHRQDHRVRLRAADQVRAGDRVLILAHRGELLEQAADKLQRSTGLVSAVEKAESTCLDSWYRVVVGSVQTLQRPARLERFPRDYFGTIIIDEAHHSITDGYRRILNYFDSAKVLGVTATPDRGDMRNLGEVFDSLAYEYKLTDAIKDGYLCRIMAQTVPLKLDISAVGMSSGDYSVGELGTALDPYLSQIAEEMAARCAGRKTVVFLPLIKTSQKFRDLLNTKGFRAAEVNGQSADRRQVLSDFEADKYNVLCNSMLLTGLGLPLGGLRRRAAAHEGAQPLQPDGGTRHPALPGQERPAAPRFPLDDRQARALPPRRPRL
ncbi:MAG: DEAD/DEAH box helicase [Faecalibacterium prausnitzii]